MADWVESLGADKAASNVLVLFIPREAEHG